MDVIVTDLEKIKFVVTFWQYSYGWKKGIIEKKEK